eukprot:CAMPEP_0115511688 /NCGR_PEP_ID=MMETSP0271-20121206/74103_1 /TAXON_ID=71861 /ORGANISM="Scrippsiella trochoidea, Strain CCMP3099" /LENGTH=79 /DNA_ID=CAMNT_0002941783 /DNA_START=704 /DNA_END=941 /DNA_ORIENTATION=-
MPSGNGAAITGKTIFGELTVFGLARAITRTVQAEASRCEWAEDLCGDGEVAAEAWQPRCMPPADDLAMPAAADLLCRPS